MTGTKIKLTQTTNSTNQTLKTLPFDRINRIDRIIKPVIAARMAAITSPLPPAKAFSAKML